MAKAIVEYELNEIPAMKASLKNLAEYYDVVSGGAITIQGAEVDNVSIAGANVSVEGSNAKITIPNVDTSTFVSSVTMQGAGAASIDSGVLNISVPASASAFTVQGSEVSAISVTGAQVSITSDTAIIDIANQTTKLNPNIVLNPATVNLTTANPVQIVSLTSPSDAISYTADGNFATIEKLSETQFKVSALSDGNDSVTIYKPENATYYSQYKVIPVTANVMFSDVNFVGGTINDTKGNLTWQTVGDVEFADDKLVLQGSYECLYTELGNNDFQNKDFTLELDCAINYVQNNGGIFDIWGQNPATGNITNSGFILQQTNNTLYWLCGNVAGNGWANAEQSGTFTNNQEMTIKLVKTTANDVTTFKGYMNGVLQYTYNLAGVPYNAHNMLSFGLNSDWRGVDMKISAIRIVLGA